MTHGAVTMVTASPAPSASLSLRPQATLQLGQNLGIAADDPDCLRTFSKDHSARRERSKSWRQRGATRRFHNVAAIHSRAVLAIQLQFSFALKHGERLRELDT
jgi:hypothetical protein